MTDITNPVEALFLQALELHDTKRVAFLREKCGEDESRLQQVQDLLAAHEQTGSFVVDRQAGWDRTKPEHNAVRVGSSIGPYKLLQEIGEGGMGVVFMADQKHPIKRRVALKIIKPGMDSKQVLARFETERQALAMMDHPNIAKVHEAGTTEGGLPYFAMELVKGVPITKFCDDNKLTTKQRLELFVDVCMAVQHAHQKGIIHRDLKPSNVLVAKFDDKPVVKVIDFGVAKATNQELTERTMFTQFGQIVGTLEYMSPEQAQFNQLDVDTRSDIYSLGVLLYELLTGAPPFDHQRLRTAAIDEIMRIIREEEPPRPSARLSTLGKDADSVSKSRNTDASTLGRLVRGDVDLIVMKAMNKDRSRRYESASGFAADLKRFLNGEPIEARPASVVYRFQRFVSKHRRAVLSTGAAFAALIAGILAVTALYIQSQRHLKRVGELALQTAFDAALRGDDEQALQARDAIVDAGLPKDDIDAIDAVIALSEVDFARAGNIAVGILGRSPDHVGARSIKAISDFWHGRIHEWATDIIEVAKLEPKSDVDRLLMAYALPLYDHDLGQQHLDSSSRVRSSPVRFMLRGLDRAQQAEDLKSEELTRLALQDYQYVAEMMPENLGVVAWRACAISHLIGLKGGYSEVDEGLRLDARQTLSKFPPQNKNECNPFLEYCRWRLLRSTGRQADASRAIELAGSHGWYSIFFLCDCLGSSVSLPKALERYVGAYPDYKNGDVRIVTQAFLVRDENDIQMEIVDAAERLLKSGHALGQLLALQCLCLIEPINRVQERANGLKFVGTVDRFGVGDCLIFLRDLDDKKALDTELNSYALSQLELTIGLSYIARGEVAKAEAALRRCVGHRIPGNTNWELADAILRRSESDADYLERFQRSKQL